MRAAFEFGTRSASCTYLPARTDSHSLSCAVLAVQEPCPPKLVPWPHARFTRPNSRAHAARRYGHRSSRRARALAAVPTARGFGVAAIPFSMQLPFTSANNELAEITRAKKRLVLLNKADLADSRREQASAFDHATLLHGDAAGFGHARAVPCLASPRSSRLSFIILPHATWIIRQTSRTPKHYARCCRGA